MIETERQLGLLVVTYIPVWPFLKLLGPELFEVFGPVLLRCSACIRIVSPAVAVADAVEIDMRGV